MCVCVCVCVCVHAYAYDLVHSACIFHIVCLCVFSLSAVHLHLQVLGQVGALPDIYTELEINYFLLRRLLGVRTEGDKRGAKVSVVWFVTMLVSVSSDHGGVCV